MQSEDKIMNGLENLRVYIDGRFVQVEKQIESLRTDIRVIDTRLIGIESRIEDMKFFVSLSFGVLAVVVAFVAFAPSIAKFFQSLRKPSLTAEQVSRMIAEALSTKQQG